MKWYKFNNLEAVEMKEGQLWTVFQRKNWYNLWTGYLIWGRKGDQRSFVSFEDAYPSLK